MCVYIYVLFFYSVVHYLLIENVYILDTFNFQECMNVEKFWLHLACILSEGKLIIFMC